MRIVLLIGFEVLLLLACAPGAKAVQYTMQIIDGVFGGASDINDRGQILGGYTTGVTLRACLWEDGVMRELGVLPGDTDSSAAAINNYGQVAGRCFGSDSVNHGFLWEDGVMQGLGALPGQGDTTAWGINDSGYVVGGSSNRPFLWRDGTMQDLGALPGCIGGRAHDINNIGQVVGWSSEASGLCHAFLWQNGVMQPLGALPGDRYSDAYGINDKGQIVGRSWAAFGAAYHAFLWEDGVMQYLGDLGGGGSEAMAINDSGQVIGYSSDPSGNPHAFVWENGMMQDLGTLPRYKFSYARGIDSSGRIVGSSGGTPVIWTPVPEPATVLALLSGFGGLALLRRRRS